MIKIAVDAGGGDFAPNEQVKGACIALGQDKDIYLILSGDEKKIREELKKYKYDASRLEIVDAPEVITNDDIPTKAVREKKNSSTVVAFQLLKEDKAEALVSTGATGAVLAAGIMQIGRIKGISRPALCPRLPNERGTGTFLCDCGANLECKSINLVHFALMATAYAEAAYGLKNPKVGLLNNGTEDHKGDELHRETNMLLKTTPNINYIGNVEGRDLMIGDTDIVVADGYTGNIALKSVEGCGKAVSHIMKKKFKKNIFTILRSLFVLDMINGIKKSMDYEVIGGAMLLGLKKTVVKGHGNAKGKGFAVYILQAAEAVRGDMVGKTEKMLADFNAKLEQATNTAISEDK